MSEPNIPPRIPHWAVNMIGATEVASGAMQGLGGLGALAVPEPTLLTKVAGAAMVLHGADTISAGVETIRTGELHDTLAKRAMTYAMEKVGASGPLANGIGAAFDIALAISPAAALQTARDVAIKAAALGSSKIVVSVEPYSWAMRHIRMALSEGAGVRWFHGGTVTGGGKLDLAFKLSRAPKASLSQVEVAIGEAQLLRAQAQVQTQIAKGAVTWTWVSGNCVTMTRSVLSEAGVSSPQWGRIPTLLPIAVRSGYGITAATATTGAVLTDLGPVVDSK
jgi:hypothetical protein